MMTDDPGSSPRFNEFGQPIGHELRDWRAPPFPPHRALEGRYCRIEPLNAARHARELHAAHGEDHTGKRWTYLFQEPFREFQAFESWCRDAEASRDPQYYCIVDAHTGKAAGSCSYLRIEPRHGVLEIGHINFSPALARTRAATEAMFLLMQNAFDLGFRRYEWKCDSCNLPSRAAATRLGFSFEGLFRQAIVYKGRNRDTAWYAIVDGDWHRGLRDAHLRWLAPANFDADGRQKQRLSELTAPFLARE